MGYAANWTMLRMCAFPGCWTDRKQWGCVLGRYRQRKGWLHRFPLNDPQRLKLWLLALHRDTILVQSGSLEAVQSTFFTRRFQIKWGKYTTISEVNSRPCVVFKNRYARTNLQRCKFSWQWKPCSVLCFKRTYVITKGLF